MTRMDFGHIYPTLVLPYGRLLRLDCNLQQPVMLENALTEA